MAVNVRSGDHKDDVPLVLTSVSLSMTVSYTEQSHAPHSHNTEHTAAVGRQQQSFIRKNAPSSDSQTKANQSIIQLTKCR